MRQKMSFQFSATVVFYFPSRFVLKDLLMLQQMFDFLLEKHFFPKIDALISINNAKTSSFYHFLSGFFCRPQKRIGHVGTYLKKHFFQNKKLKNFEKNCFFFEKIWKNFEIEKKSIKIEKNSHF